MLKKHKQLITVIQILILTLITACNSGGESPDTLPTPVRCIEERNELEQSLHSDLDSHSTDTDFTLLVVSENGRQFEYNRGNSSPQTLYRSASTSKMVTSTVVLSLVESGVLSLQDKPQDYIENWPVIGNLSNITLKQLLSFTSGLNEAPICINLASANFAACVDNILTTNLENTVLGGEEFYYSSTHMQVAGLMAVLASGEDSWQDVFEQFKVDTKLFTSSQYDLPSLENPRLAGGMHWIASDYLDFLQALFHQNILMPELITEMTQDQLTDASIVYSPSEDLNEDWHYGLGVWIECHSTSFNCDSVTRISSPGTYGAYPFIDFTHRYFGILAREGTLGSFSEGYEVFNSVSQKLEQWATMDCL